MSLNRKIKKLQANAPKYEIQDEAFQNQALARSNAFGRDKAIEMQEENLDQDAANAVSQARDITSSTSGLLSTLAAINSNRDTAKRGLAQDEAALQQQKMGQLMGANQAMIDEKDKAWNYNVNMPYQTKIADLRDRKKARSELAGSIIGGVAGIGASLLTGGLAGGVPKGSK